MLNQLTPKFIKFFLFLQLAFFSACTTFNQTNNLEPAANEALNNQKFSLSLENSLKYYKQKINELTTTDSISMDNKDYFTKLSSYKNFLHTKPSASEHKKWLENNFLIKTISDEVLFTGYYRASLNGSRKKHGNFRYPIYKRPSNLYQLDLRKFPNQQNNSRPLFFKLEGKTAEPFYTRQEIDGFGKLKDKNLEIVWVDDLVELFFLHIQGSGIVNIDDGSVIELGYSASNSRPYYSIGNWLVKNRNFEASNISKQTIIDYLKKHPEDLASMLFSNESYVFFEEKSGGAFGSLGYPVNALHSVATDPKIYPKGSLLLIEYTNPISDKKVLSLVFNQDTGGAIVGKDRIDLYCGSGKLAEELAGKLKSNGSARILLPK